MSLDVYLNAATSNTSPVSDAIFIRRDGANVEITREKWDQLYPGREPVVLHVGGEETNEVYCSNITHNLSKMADAAGVYECLWRPDEVGITKAAQLIDPLTKGLAELQSNPAKYKTFNPPNGWGSYDRLLTFVADYLKACEKYPDAEVRVSR